MKKVLYAVVARGIGVKIGISANPKRRLRQLQTGSCHKLTVLAEMRCLHPRLAERAAHQYLSSYRMAGEWFRVRPAEVKKILIKASKTKTALYNERSPIKRYRSRGAKSLTLTSSQRQRLDAYARKNNLGYVDAIMHAIDH